MARREDSDNPAVAGVAHRESVKQSQVDEFYERQANLQPTPTQAEIDLARVGAQDIDQKEDDGSEWQDEGTNRVLTAKLAGNNPYDVRSEDTSGGASGEEGSSSPRRGRRKSSSDEE
jgi:hypothetical protein